MDQSVQDEEQTNEEAKHHVLLSLERQIGFFSRRPFCTLLNSAQHFAGQENDGNEDSRVDENPIPPGQLV
jgi:hypothetical protein